MGFGVALAAWGLNENTFASRWGRGVGSKTPEGLRRGNIGEAEMGAQRGQQLGSSMGTALPSHPWASPCRFWVGLILPEGPFPTAPGAEFSLSGYSRGGSGSYRLY